MAFPPTEQQQQAIDAYATGEDILISAYAGAGKTSTLKMQAASDPELRIIYLAYNKAIATDAAASFPSNTNCRTAHSFAYGAVGRKYADRLKAPRQTAKQAATMLGINSAWSSEFVKLSPASLARLAKETVLRFCYSADDKVKLSHVPMVPGVDMGELAPVILPYAQKIWADAQFTDGRFKFEHDYYLKMFILTEPKLPCDVVMLDEAQDSNPSVASLVAMQDQAQKVIIGDTYQQLYAWRGAVDAMHSFGAKHHIKLTQSFRFGPAIADEANKWLKLLGADLPLEGFDAIPSKIEPLEQPDTILCRTNAGVIEAALNASEDGRTFAVVGGTGHIIKFAEAARSLINGQPCFHPDLIAFQNWQQVKDYVEEEGSGDIGVLVKIVDRYGVDVIERIAHTAVNDERYADTVISTAHKAKGREWNSVKIANDFIKPEEQDDGVTTLPPDLGMLAYVSVTRAMQTLDNSGLAWVDDLIPTTTEAV